MSLAVETFLTMQDLADRWGIALQTIRGRRVNGGALPKAFKIGNRVRFKLSDVEAFEAEHTE